jgi:hypothetical protein
VEARANEGDSNIDTVTAAQLGFDIYQQQLDGSSDNQFAPFASKLDWDIARWAKTNQILLSTVD